MSRDEPDRNSPALADRDPLHAAPRCGWALPCALLLALLIPARPLLAQEPAPPPIREVQLEGARLTLTGDPDAWQAQGELTLTPLPGPSDAPPPWSLTARAARLEGSRLTLEGVALRLGARRLRAETLTIDLDTGAAEGEAVELIAPVEGSDRVVRLRGERMSVERERIVIDGAALEPCGCPDDAGERGGLVVTAEQARLVLQGPLLDLRDPTSAAALSRDGVAEADDVTLAAGPLPLAWVPSLTWPLDGRRSGLLPPTVGGMGDDQGVHLGAGAFWALAPSQDLTLGGWWRTGGVGGAALTWRHAEADHLGDARRGELTVTGVHDALDEATQGASVRGRGAVSGAGLPDVRYDLRYSSSTDLVERLRAPMAERLGAPTRSAVLVGEVGAWSALEAQAQMVQLLDVPGSLWRRDARSFVSPEVAFSLRSQPAGPLLLNLGLRFVRVAPLAADGSSARAVFSEGLDPTNRLSFDVALEAPLVRGRGGSVRLLGALAQTLDVFSVPRDDDPQGNPQPPRTALRQRTVAWGALQASTRLLGRPGGVPHTIRPALRLSGAGWRDVSAFDPELEPEAYPTAPYDPALPRWAAQGVLQQRLGRADRLHLDLDLGGLALQELRPAWSVLSGPLSPALPDHLTRAGGELRLGGPHGWLRGDLNLELQGNDTGLHEATGAAGLSWDPSGLLEVGAGRFTAGPRLTHTPWRLDDASLPGIHPFARPGDMTAATARLQLPAPGLSALQLRLHGLAPIDGDGVAPEDAEVSGAIALGQLAGCVELELRASRYTTPRVMDLFLTARVGPF